MAGTLEIDGHDIERIKAAKLKRWRIKPSLIVAKTTIAKWAPTKAGTAASHGAPLGEEEIRGSSGQSVCLKIKQFYVPEELQDLPAAMHERGKKLEAEWNELFAKWSEEYPELAEKWHRWMNGEVPSDIDDSQNVL